MNLTSGLWRHSDFVKLWAGQTVSLYGSLITRIALPFTAILVLNATPFQIAWLRIADLLPGFLVGLVAGVWVDRLRRRPLMIVADLGRALLLGSIPVAAFLHHLGIGQIYLVAFLAGMLTIVFDVAYLAYLPSLLRPEELVEGNSKLAASGSVAEVSAFGLAGWLVQIFTGPVAVLIDACSFLFSAASVALIRREEPALPPTGERQSLRVEIVEGLRFILSNRPLRAAAAGLICLELSYSFSGAVYLLFVTRGLGFRPGVLGLIFAVGGVSSLAGALLAQWSIRRLGSGPAMICGLLLAGLGSLFVPLAHGATLVAVVLLVAQQLVADGGATVFVIGEQSLRQTLAPNRLLGRVNASIRFTSLGLSMVGLLLSGLLGETIGLRLTLVVGAGVMFFGALLLLLSPLRRLKEPLAVSS
ncbi:MAG: MFS transporter [Dehalococcoidia bacterium]